MKIFNTSMRGRGVIFVMPGKEHPEVPEWSERAFDLEGREYMKPRQLVVKFQNGVAEVADNLAAYMIEHGHAQASRGILSAKNAALVAEAEIDRLNHLTMSLTRDLRAANARIAELEAQLARSQDAAELDAAHARISQLEAQLPVIEEAAA